MQNIKLPLNNYFSDDLEPDEDGLVALGGELNSMILIEAYSKGIFPWTGEHPIPWFSPHPRLVMYTEKYHISKSMKKFLKTEDYKVKYDNDFLSVINNCASVGRKHEDGTWITSNMIESYHELFNLNIAHCVEVYNEGVLCGGVYGIALGKTFFGESMFHTKTNYSKIAFYYLVQKLLSLNITMIDCQQSTKHLLSMGAEEISRSKFQNNLDISMKYGINNEKWL